MQTFSAILAVGPGPAGDQIGPVVDALSHSSLFDLKFLALFLVAGQVVAILAYYLSSKVLADSENSTFTASLRVWLLYWLFTIVAVVISGATIFGVIAAQSYLGSGALLIAIVLLVIASLIAIVRIPMDVYEIGAVKGIGFVVISSILMGMGSAGLSVALAPNRDEQVKIIKLLSSLTPEQQKEAFRRVMGDRKVSAIASLPLDGEKEAADTSRSLQERGEALKRMYTELENRRKSVKPDDQAGAAIYRQQKARYEALLQQIRDDVARAKAAAPR